MDLVNFTFLGKLLKLSVKTGLASKFYFNPLQAISKVPFCTVSFVKVCASGWPPGNAPVARCLLVVQSGWLGTAARSAVNPWAPPAELRG